MVKRIEWSQKAIKVLSATIKYLKLEVSFSSSEKFVQLIQHQINRIEKYPNIGRKVKNRKTLRFVLVGTNHRLYYRVNGTILYITAIFDTRQSPNKEPY